MRNSLERLLRARHLVDHADPRIDHALTRMRTRPTSPDEAYWQAALRVAKQDERRELAQRHPVAYTIGYALGWTTMLAIPAGLGWLRWRLLSQSASTRTPSANEPSPVTSRCDRPKPAAPSNASTPCTSFPGFTGSSQSNPEDALTS